MGGADARRIRLISEVAPAASGARPLIDPPAGRAEPLTADAPTDAPLSGDAPAQGDGAPDATSAIRSAWRLLRGILERYGERLWWLHSLWALGLGVFVVFFAQKGYDHARVLVGFMGAAWLLLILLFRLFGSGSERELDTTVERFRYYAMTYVLKNLHQGMLFFLLPFYWKSTTLGSPNQYFVILLGLCAALSTLDVVFDRVLMRWRDVASTFYALILFACLNLVIPALFPSVATLITMGGAAIIAIVAFWTIHHPLWFLDGPQARRVGLSVVLGVGLVLVLRPIVPPVPMYVKSGAVGPRTLADGRLALEVSALHFSLAQQMYAVTDVVLPAGDGERLHHVWRFKGEPVLDLEEETDHQPGPGRTVRLSSRMPPGTLPDHPVGRWSVDVVTWDGRLVGRTRFTVLE